MDATAPQRSASRGKSTTGSTNSCPRKKETSLWKYYFWAQVSTLFHPWATNQRANLQEKAASQPSWSRWKSCTKKLDLKRRSVWPRRTGSTRLGRYSSKQPLLTFLSKVPIIRSNVIDAMEVNVRIYLDDLHQYLDPARCRGREVQVFSGSREQRVGEESESCARDGRSRSCPVPRHSPRHYHPLSGPQHSEVPWAEGKILCESHTSIFTFSTQLPDSAPYFLRKAATIGEADYLPSDEDVLRARSQTTGVNSMDFMVS